MNTKITLLKTIIENLIDPNNKSIHMSLNNVHAKGLFSLVVSGLEPGKLVRIFIADNKLKPYGVQLHTHRYPIRLTAIKGTIKHYLAHEVSNVDCTTINLSQYNYKSYLNGGGGLEFINNVDVKITNFIIPPGSTIEMTTKEFHTVSCSKGSIWIVEELGFETETSKVLGIPFVVENLYSKPEQFQINDKIQIVIHELKKIIQNYELV